MLEDAETTDLEKLRARIVTLEAEVAGLTERVRLLKDFPKLQGKVDALWDGFMEYRDERNKWFENAFDRIINLECHVFPNLVSDMASVHQIIGLEGEKSPLDSRNTSPDKKKDPRD